MKRVGANGVLKPKVSRSDGIAFDWYVSSKSKLAGSSFEHVIDRTYDASARGENVKSLLSVYV